MLGRVGAVWGVTGVIASLVEAVTRLLIHAREALGSGLAPWQWALTIAWVAVMAYAEGVRGFHQRFAPRVVARALYLIERPRVIDAVLAPFFCMSMYHASRRGLRVAWGLVIGIVTLVLLVRLLPFPYRGIVDAGVVAGLSVGTVSLVWHSARALLGKPPNVDRELPQADGSK